MTVVSEKYASLGGSAGWLGRPVSGELASSDGDGLCRHYQQGSIFWSAETGAHVINGAIQAKHAALGGEAGVLGYPTADAVPCESGDGDRCGRFQNGIILWRAGAAEAFASHGPVLAHWQQSGFVTGPLGFPVGDVARAADQVGQYQHFEAGSIYWKPTTGAHAMHGGIRRHWAAEGWEANQALGYPVSGVLAHGGDAYAEFENGVVYWQRASQRAIELAPAVRLARAEMQTLMMKLAAQLPQLSGWGVHLEDGPRIVAISDYRCDAAGVHGRGGGSGVLGREGGSDVHRREGGSGVYGRQYVLFVRTRNDEAALTDADCDIKINVRIDLDRARSAVTASVSQWSTPIHAPWRPDWGQQPAGIGCGLKARLDSLVGAPHVVQAIPPASDGSILSAKVMPNGDFNVYVAP